MLCIYTEREIKREGDREVKREEREEKGREGKKI